MSNSGSVEHTVKVKSAGVAERQAVRVRERNRAVFWWLAWAAGKMMLTSHFLGNMRLTSGGTSRINYQRAFRHQCVISGRRDSATHSSTHFKQASAFVEWHLNFSRLPPNCSLGQFFLIWGLIQEHTVHSVMRALQSLIWSIFSGLSFL